MLGFQLGLRGGMSPALSSHWTPARLPNLAGWWDAEDALTAIGPNTPTAIGQTIRRVPDRSGNGRHMDQATGNAQPILGYLNGVDASNGLAMVADGVDDLLLTASFPTNTARTIAMVVSIESDGLLFFVGDHWSSYAGGALYDDLTTPHIMVQRGGADVLVRSPITPPFGIGQGPIAITAQHANQKENIRVWKSGISVPLTTGSGVDGLDFSENLPFCLFGRPEENYPIKARIAEVLLFNRHLHDAERGNINRYFARKYHL